MESFLEDTEAPVKYLCLIYRDEATVESMPERESAALQSDMLSYRDQIQQSGHLVLASALQPVQTATTIRVRNDHMSITDGPFAETREQLGGFYLIEATDLNDAIRVVAKTPLARLGSIEVRPLKEFSPRQPDDHCRGHHDATS